jgi:hypothetical protein
MVGERRHDTWDWSGDGDIESYFDGMNIYSSQDLLNWKYEGIACTPQEGTCINSHEIVERPKILYNNKIGKYIMYLKSWYHGGVIACATSLKVTGPYTYQGILNFTDGSEFNNIGDQALFIDTDGTAYLATIGRVYPLNSTYTAINATVNNYAVLPSHGTRNQEAPSIFKKGNTYFALRSSEAWWHATDDFYATATSMMGPWTDRGFFAPAGSLTFNSQNTFVLPVTGSSDTTYIFMGDRWCNGNWSHGTYVWQPLTVNGNTISISAFHPAWTINVSTGKWSDVADTGISSNDKVTGTGQNQFNYSGTWDYSTDPGCFNKDYHYSSTTNDLLTFPFTGTQIKLYGVVDSCHGIMGVTLCDNNGNALQHEMLVDQFTEAPRQGNYLLYVSPVESPGSYQLKVRVTGSKNHYSTGNKIAIDRISAVYGVSKH